MANSSEIIVAKATASIGEQRYEVSIQAGDVGRLEPTLYHAGLLNEEQRKRLAEIAERTPVMLAIKGGLPIQIELGHELDGAGNGH